MTDNDGRSNQVDRLQSDRKYPHIQPRDENTALLLDELVAHLRQKRSELREEWAYRIQEAELLTAMNKQEILAEATSAVQK